MKSNEILTKLNRFFAPLGMNIDLFIGTFMLFLLNPILSSLENIEIVEAITGEEIVSESISFIEFWLMLKDDMPVIEFIVISGIVITILSAVIMLLPLLIKKRYCFGYMILTDIISIVAFTAISFFFIILFLAYRDDMINELISLKITFAGWALILDTIILPIISITLTKQLKSKKAGVFYEKDN